MPTEIVGTMAVSGGQKQTALLMPGAYPAEKVTYNGGNVDDDLDSLHFNTRGTQVDVSGYTSSANMYTFPYDGYLSISATTSGAYFQVRIIDAGGGTIGSIQGVYTGGQAHRQLVYVRKGMQTYVNTSNGDVSVLYSPLIS